VLVVFWVFLKGKKSPQQLRGEVQKNAIRQRGPGPEVTPAGACKVLISGRGRAKSKRRR